MRSYFAPWSSSYHPARRDLRQVNGMIPSINLSVHGTLRTQAKSWRYRASLVIPHPSDSKPRLVPCQSVPRPCEGENLCIKQLPRRATLLQDPRKPLYYPPGPSELPRQTWQRLLSWRYLLPTHIHAILQKSTGYESANLRT